jgi:catechol 2,3-dioxygenase-like lactoylglutathione lyase family enzyme
MTTEPTGRVRLADFPVHATIAASDLERARRWYEEHLDLVPEETTAEGAWYRFGGATWLYLYATPAAGAARNTVAGITVRGIERVMADLRGRGVIFDEYDMGEFRTVDGLAVFGGFRAAWFTDSEGNILELSEVPERP